MTARARARACGRACARGRMKPGHALGHGSGRRHRNIRSMHIKRCNSVGEMIGPVAPPWAS
eukprot:scaffold80036_cov61-Phaeocystis_antarctica.AAC.1